MGPFPQWDIPGILLKERYLKKRCLSHLTQQLLMWKSSGWTLSSFQVIKILTLYQRTYLFTEEIYLIYPFGRDLRPMTKSEGGSIRALLFGSGPSLLQSTTILKYSSHLTIGSPPFKIRKTSQGHNLINQQKNIICKRQIWFLVVPKS